VKITALFVVTILLKYPPCPQLTALTASELKPGASD
jgi:hypothetical protein